LTIFRWFVSEICESNRVESAPRDIHGGAAV